MPRKLPWMQKGGSSTTLINRTKQSTTSTTKPRKRAREEDAEPDDSGEDTGASSKRKSRARTQSTSPVPEPPPEIFMHEGVDRDDKYRMVEDEFLSVAQKWTVHLHAKEYKRLEKMVKAHNAETINSISRPISDRMPNHTRRREESVAKSKAQRDALKGLLRNKPDAEDTDSDENRLPYVGTSLHDLMGSPGKRSASLSKIRPAKVTTRAAAGFQKPAPTKTASYQRTEFHAPSYESNHPPILASKDSEVSTASEDEDDDLDAPIPAPKLKPVQKVRCSTAMSSSNSHSITSSQQTSELNQKSTLVQSAVGTVKKSPPGQSLTDFEPPRALSDAAGWRAKKFEEAQQAKRYQEKEEQKKKKLDIIPTFM